VRQIFLFIAFTLLFCVEVSAQVTKVLISGTGSTSDSLLQVSFKAGYASHNNATFGGIITTFVDGSVGISNSFVRARDSGYQVIIRSTSGLSSVIDTAVNYPQVQVFMPAGANSYTQIFTGNITTCPVISTGCGDSQNRTGYSIEFWGPNPLSSPNNGLLSSYSNAYIAGQMSFLANYGIKTITQVRALARQYGDTFDIHNGYGKIKVDTLFKVLPVELISFTAKLNNKNVLLDWKTATEVNNYGFEIERKKDSWVKIGFIEGAGTTNAPKQYSFSDQDILSRKYFYRLKQIDRDGKFEYSMEIEVNTVNTPNNFLLSQNYPNPFNPNTIISYQIPNNGIVTLKVFDVLGKEVVMLVNESKQAGKYEVNFNASSLSSGVYFYRLQAGSLTEIKKMILNK
jgi:hypothetical protein